MSHIFCMAGTGDTTLLFVGGAGIVFTYGLLAAMFSIVGIYREQSELERVRDGKSIMSPEDVKNVLRVPWLEFEMRPGHLELRKAAIDECMRKWRESADKDKLPILPSLSDLHELTLYRESHRNSSTALATGVSVLLIAGICGTMLNVHAALGGKIENMLNILKLALEPARSAVLFTVILLVLKGMYTALVTHYIADLDSYTIKKIMPDQHREIYRRVVDCYRETADEMKKFRDSDIRRFCSDASGELAATKKHINACSNKHKVDVKAWNELSFPVYKISWQNHVEGVPPLSVEATSPEQVQVWDELNQTIADIARFVKVSPS